MKLFLHALAFALILSPFHAVAEESHDDHAGIAAEERVEHYEGAAFTNAAEATTIMDEKIAEISSILTEEETLSDASLEKIHEISYTLEDSIDFLRSENQDNPVLHDIDEAVQALHYASENHEAAKTTDWFTKLQAARNEMKTATETANTAEAAPIKKDQYEIIIKDHKFEPETLVVPAGEKIKLIVDNQDPTPEEFESHDFNREKIIAGKTKATIFVGPLEPGKYHYFGEFNMDSANGYIVAETTE